MAQTQTPFGMLCRWHPSGQSRGMQYENVILSGQTPSIYFGTPVVLGVGQASATPKVNNGNSQTITVTAASGQSILLPAFSAVAATCPLLGVFDGCEYTDATGVRKYSKFWQSGTTTLAGTYVIAYVWDDPENIYEIQCDGALNTGSNAYQYYGRQFNLNTADLGSGTAPAGNAVPVGQSSQRLNATPVTANGITIGTSNTGQLVCVQAPDISNVGPAGNITDPFPSLYVKINAHQQKSPFGIPASI